MLVITRREQEVLLVGDDIRIVVIRTESGHVKLGIDAPREIRVDRLEVRERINQARAACARNTTSRYQLRDTPM